MSNVLEQRSYREAIAEFSWQKLWDLFDGDPERMNLARECLDRHPREAIALRIQYADGTSGSHTFGELADDSGRFANWLGRLGVQPGERVAVVLDPSSEFYLCMFGAMKYGAVAVPMFTLFGPEGLALRLDDCRPAVILANGDTAWLRGRFPRARVVAADAAWREEISREPAEFHPSTRASDLALFQYTSGTTRELPEAVRHSHRAVVTLMVAALYGLGLRPGDRYFCPSSPAWGHGLSHGTLAPLALGIGTCAYSGKFDPQRIFQAMEAFDVDNMAAAPTVFRMLRNSGLRNRYRLRLRKLSYAGEPMDAATARWIEEDLGVVPCSMYGTTEVGVVIVNYPGYDDYRVRPGALGQPAPGVEVAVLDDRGEPAAPGQAGEIAVRRKGQWFLAKDSGYVDEEGYFHIGGRSDDVIISAGWTMSAVEIENTLLKHPQVLEAAVVGVPDELRGQIAKAYVVARAAGPEIEADIQAFMKAELSKHEYPRQVEFVAELPKTPAGKVNRKALRSRTQAAA